jgi:hypothetical protein
MQRNVSSSVFVPVHHIATALPCILRDRLCMSLNSVYMGNLGTTRKTSSFARRTRKANFRAGGGGGGILVITDNFATEVMLIHTPCYHRRMGT